MTSILQKFEEQQLEKLTENKDIPDFQPGDTVRVDVKIIEGTNERIQAFEGVCIAKKNGGINSSFTVRKISHGEGVERVFSTYSPLVAAVKVVRKGDVRRAKLYYMRGLTGKAARIKEKRDLNVVSKKDAAKAKTTETTAPKAEEKAETKEAPKAEAPKEEAKTEKTEDK